jgi:hypothetical protein
MRDEFAYRHRAQPRQRNDGIADPSLTLRPQYGKPFNPTINPPEVSSEVSVPVGRMGSRLGGGASSPCN